MQPAKCRSCGASILWLYTAAGNLSPIDASPSEKGNIAIIDGRAHVVKPDLFEPMIPAGPRYLSHFATCEFAAKHRKKKEAKP